MGIKFVKKTIGDCFDLINGYAFKSNEFISSGNPVIKIKNIKAGYFSEHEFSYVDDNFLITKTEKIVQESDLLISMTGNRHDGTPETWVGKIALFPYKKINNFFLNQRVGALRVKDNAKINPIYASYVLSSWEYQQWFIAIATSSGGQANLSPKQILETEFEFPDKNIQDLIANILSSFDKKITLNRQINQTLEQMAQTLFKSWFVDFDPVIDNALDAGNDIPDTLQKCAEQRRLLRVKADFKPLPAETRALFPSEFEETELGWVPKGWEPATIGKTFDVTMGQSPPGSTYNEDGIGMPFFQGKTDFGFRYPTNRVYCSEPKRFAEKDDTLISVRAPVGDANMAVEKCAIGRGVAAIRHKSSSASFTYYSIKNLSKQFDVFNGEGTVFGSINQKDMNEIKLLNIPELLIHQFDIHASTIDKKIEVTSSQIDALIKIRDSLLPKLISGELALDALPEMLELAEAL